MRRLGIGLLTLALAACGSIEEPDGLPLGVELRASVSSTKVGATIDFDIHAQGRGLQSLTLSFGDGAQESLPLEDAILVQVSRRHVYMQAGSFLVTATAQERSGGTVQDTIRIEVSEEGVLP